MKKKMLFMTIAMAIIIATTMIGCGGTQTINAGVDRPAVSVCDAIPAGSWSLLCEIATISGTTPEAVSKTLQLANTTALAADAYTAEQADKFIADVDAWMVQRGDGGVSYTGLLAYIKAQHELLPPKVGAAIVIATQFLGVDPSALTHQALSAYDVALIRRHLKEQRAIVALMGGLA